MEGHNVSAWMATNRWFVGHKFLGVTAIEHVNLAPPCPLKPGTAGGRRPYFQRLKDVTFWHSREDFATFGRRVETIRQMLPSNMFFYPAVTWPVLCWGSDLTRSGYYDSL
jgi:hypothetical protein